jgi:catechol 2,3-dioxygenase
MSTPGYRVAVDAPRDPEQLEAGGPRAGGRLAPATTVGAVALTVADIERSVHYYTRSIGLRVLDRGGGVAIFGAADTPLVVVVQHPGASAVGRHTGLYHFALLLPERPDLARWLAHAARDRVRLVGLSDHFVSEALYLSDPDGHGIEIYWDRPRAGWEGQVAARMTTLRLDVADLLGELDDPRTEPFDGLPAGTRMGHIHLKVAAIPATVDFYRDVIGFGLMAQLGGQAAFLSAGGYHHHLGANTWESAGAAPPPGGRPAPRDDRRARRRRAGRHPRAGPGRRADAGRRARRTAGRGPLGKQARDRARLTRTQKLSQSTRP